MTVTWVTAVLVGFGAAVGSLCRYSLGLWMTKVTNSEFPWGTWVVNVLGTLLMGLFFQQFDVLHHAKDLWALLGTGFCGGFTTFSTMSVETVRLFRSNRPLGFVYIGSSLAVGLIAVWITQWL